MLNKEPDTNNYSDRLNNCHCIWMSAGVISFKLCPIEFDCEHCDFDAVMRQRTKQLHSPTSNKEPT